MSKTIVGVVGPGEGAPLEACHVAYDLGVLIARQGWVLLTGGRDAGVMDAANRGAHEAGGLTIGILPTENTDGMSGAIDLPIITGMGQARNVINVLSSRVVFACGIGAGTASEISLALKLDRPVILLSAYPGAVAFFKTLGGANVSVAATPAEAVAKARLHLADQT